jgi:hypothetical protein
MTKAYLINEEVLLRWLPMIQSEVEYQAANEDEPSLGLPVVLNELRTILASPTAEHVAWVMKTIA